VKTITGIGFLLLLVVIQATSQNIVTGTITSVPSNTPASQTRITFTNTSNGSKYSQLSLDGTFNINLPSGTYERKIEGLGNYQLLDEIIITGSQTLNEKIIDVEPVTSTVYGPSGQNRSLLYLLKRLTNSDGVAGNTLLYRVTNQNPWRLYARNYNVSDPESMPSDYRPYLDYILNDIQTKIPEIVFNEQTTPDPNNGITFIFPTTANMPQPVSGWTIADENNATIYIDREKYHNFSREIETGYREIVRAKLLKTFSTDPAYVTNNSGNLVETLHPDEVNVIRRMLNLTYLTDMTKHRDVAITSVPNTIFSSVSVSTPANNSTVTYDGAGNFSLTHNRNGERDAEGDQLSQTWKVYQNNVLYKTYTASHNNAVTVNKSDFSAHTTYTATVTLSDGFLQVTSPAVTFSTPNILPTQSITSPANNATVSYDANNRFEIITTPNTATDADGDNLSKTISIYVLPFNMLVKSVTTANNNQVFVLKSELNPHTNYAIKATLSDGVSTTSEVTSNFTTPNVLPVQAISSPANNATVSYDANNRFEIVTTPSTAIDGDGENLTKTIEVRKTSTNALVKTVTTANSNQVFVLKSELEPHTAYTIKATLTDGFATTAVVSSNFSTPNTLPPAQAITSPANNATVSYDANNRFEIVTTPNTATDADGDNLNKTIEVRKVSTNALVKTVTVANNTQVFVLKTELEAHTGYAIKATLTDGIATTSVVSSNFSTPNTLPTQAITSPANNATVSYDVNNQFEIITTPNTATDADGDNLNKTIEVRKVSTNALVKTVTVANNTQMFVLKTELEPHTAYTIKSTLTDGIETTPMVSSNFNTPNTLPALEITSPINNATVTFDANDKLFIVTSPNAAKDADNDDLTKIIRVSGPGLDTTITKPNTTDVYMLNSRLASNANYTIEARLTDGIETSPTKSVIFKTPIIVGIENLLGEFKIYPNPFNQHLTIESPGPIDIRMITSTGTEILRQDGITHRTISLDVAPGIYLLMIIDKSRTTMRKVVKH
jgi:hypothetical protein